MGIFDLFTTAQEKVTKDLLANKPQYLMHTTNVSPDKIHSIRPAFNDRKNQNLVFATEDEKIAKLYALYPFYYFEFGNGEIGAVIIGKNHKLLDIDKITSYIYYINASSFEPDVSEQGGFSHEWFSQNEIIIDQNIENKKITFEDVLKEGIQVFWVSDKATLLSIDNQMSSLTNGEQKLEFLINQANWTPGKFMYMNAYKKICPVISTENGLVIDRNQNLINQTQHNTSVKNDSIITNQNSQYNNNYSNQKVLNNYKN